MRYTVKGGMFSSYSVPTVPMDTFYVEDENGTTVYRFTCCHWKRRLQIFDVEGNSLALIRSAAFLLRCRITYATGKVVHVRRSFALFEQAVVIKSRGQKPVYVRGNFREYEYRFTCGNVLGAVTRQGVGREDCYFVDVDLAAADPLLILASAVCVDILACHGAREISINWS